MFKGKEGFTLLALVFYFFKMEGVTFPHEKTLEDERRGSRRAKLLACPCHPSSISDWCNAIWDGTKELMCLLMGPSYPQILFVLIFGSSDKDSKAKKGSIWKSVDQPLPLQFPCPLPQWLIAFQDCCGVSWSLSNSFQHQGQRYCTGVLPLAQEVFIYTMVRGRWYYLRLVPPRASW